MELTQSKILCRTVSGPAPSAPFSPEGRQALAELVQTYGCNTNTALTLYDGYHFFTPGDLKRDGAIAFVETDAAWVGAAEPLCPAEQASKLLVEFAAQAKRHGKLALMLPVSRRTRDLAAAAGYGSLKIGGEPQFDLSTFDPVLDGVSTARRLAAKGATVVEVRPEGLSAERKTELQALIADWLGSRKMETLSFLNRVEPWALSDYKRYFYVELDGHALAFVAGVSIPARRGWYLVDLFRRSDSPPGSTEMLLLEAMRLLREDGARLITLGVAPLSELNSEDEPNHRWLARFLHLVYERGNLFYNFKSLYQFKQKFHPTHSEANYLIYSPPKLGPRATLELAHAFLGTSVLHSMRTSLERRLRLFHPEETLRAHFSPSVVMRSMPTDLWAILTRCRLSIFIGLVNIVMFFLTVDSQMRLRPDFASRFAFSIPSMEDGNVLSFLVSPFLHWGLAHLIMNLLTLTCFAATLEYLAGTSFVGFAFGAGAFLANPITSVIFFFPFRWIYPPWWESFRGIEDVGASLGIFGCAGALTVFFRRAPLLLTGMAFGTFLYSAYSGDPLSMNHLTSAVLGLVTTTLLLKSPRFLR